VRLFRRHHPSVTLLAEYRVMSAPHPQVIHEEPDELISALDSQLTLGTGDVSGQCQWGYNTGEYDQGDDGGSSARSSPVLWAGDGSDEDEPRYGCDLCIGGCCRDIGEPGCGVCHCCKALTELGVDDSSTCPVFSAHSMIASLECIFFFSTRSTKPRLRLLQLHVTARR